MKRTNLFNLVINNVLYGEGEGGNTPTPTQTTPTPTPTQTQTPPKTFTQAEVDDLMKENRRNLQTKNTELSTKLQEAIDSGKLTAEQVVEHKRRIDELTSEYQTKEELAQDAYKKLENKYNTEKAALTDETKLWKNRFGSSLIKREITDAALAAEAFKPQQIVDLLEKNARFVETVDDQQKPTGEFETKIKFTVMKDGKPTTLDLSPTEALKIMKETPNEYGNLFKSGAISGLGAAGGNGTGNNGRKPLSEMSQAEYKKHRTEILAEADKNKG